MVKSFCDKCSKLEEAAILSHFQPELVSGVIIKCEIDNSFCIYHQSQIYFTKLRNRNKERIIKKYHEKPL